MKKKIYHEYLSFIVYSSLPVFRDIMRPEYYTNLKKLVLFIEVILSPTIKRTDLRSAESIVFEFVEELQELYPPSIMLSGVHELLHLVDSTFWFGPLNTLNCFQYEELNRKLVGFIHGYDLIGEELIKIFSTAQILSGYSNSISNTHLQEFIGKKLLFKTSNRKRFNSKPEIYPVDKPSNILNHHYAQLVENYTNKTIDRLITCEKISYNGILFTSLKNLTKRCESAFVNKKNQFGLIERFVLYDNTVYVVAKRLVSIFNAYINGTNHRQS